MAEALSARVPTPNSPKRSKRSEGHDLTCPSTKQLDQRALERQSSHRIVYGLDLFPPRTFWACVHLFVFLFPCLCLYIRPLIAERACVVIDFGPAERERRKAAIVVHPF